MENSITHTANKLLIIVPSKGRPDNAKRLLNRIIETSHLTGRIDIIFALDYTDTSSIDYPQTNIVLVEGGNMVKALNEVANTEHHIYKYLSFMGDDVLPHDGWADKILDVLDSGPNQIVYGNDLAQGAKLPTAVFMDSSIIKTLGFMAPPNQRQLFVDNFWKHLGESLGTLTYIDDAILEHMHPHVNKAPHDKSYEAAYSFENESRDEKAFTVYMAEQFSSDIEKFL